MIRSTSFHRYLLLFTYAFYIFGSWMDQPCSISNLFNVNFGARIDTVRNNVISQNFTILKSRFSSISSICLELYTIFLYMTTISHFVLKCEQLIFLSLVYET